MRSGAPAADEVPGSCVHIDQLPTYILTHILTKCPSDNLCRWLALVATVCREWRRVAQGCMAHGVELPSATTRSAVLRFVSATMMRLQTTNSLDLSSYLVGSHLTRTRLGDQPPTWDVPAQSVLGASLFALPEPVQFAELNLERCTLSPAGLKQLLMVTRLHSANYGLTKLDISMNPGLGDAGVAILAERLPRSLQSLVICGCSIGDAGLCSLMEKLPEGLQHLDCSHNRAVGKRGWVAVGKGLRQLQKLEELVLKGCHMGDDSVAVIGSHLPSMPALVSVDLEANKLGVPGARSLAAALPQCASLRKMRVGQNFGIGIEGQEVLEQGVRQCSWEAEFDLYAEQETNEDVMEEMVEAAQQMVPVVANLGAENLQSLASVLQAMVPTVVNSNVLPAATTANLQHLVAAMVDDPQHIQSMVNIMANPAVVQHAMGVIQAMPGGMGAGIAAVEQQMLEELQTNPEVAEHLAIVEGAINVLQDEDQEGHQEETG